MIQDIMDFLSQADPEVGASIQKEFDREQHNIELIASENIVSKAVLLAMGMQDGARYLIREYDLPLTETQYYDVMREVIAEL